MRTYCAPLLALLVPGCLCGQEITGDAGFDSGIYRDAGPDAGMDGGAGGRDAGDAGSDGGDSGIDCSTKCTIGGMTYCAYQLDPSGTCSQCIPTESSTSWSNAALGSPCKIQNPTPGIHAIGEGYLPPVGPEECTCFTNGSHCRAPTACCMGVCQDSGLTTFCAGEEGTFCNSFTPCAQGRCCLNPDGGGGVCSSDAGTCPG
jgi:hypothetical protein